MSRIILFTFAIADAIVLAGCPAVESTGEGGAGGEGDPGLGGGAESWTKTLPPPLVLCTVPFGGALDVATNPSVSAAFSQKMNPATITRATFTLTRAHGGPAVEGTVLYAGTTAVFWPSSHLETNSMYTAKVTTGAESAAGMELPASQAWSFTTGTQPMAGPGVVGRGASR